MDLAIHILTGCTVAVLAFVLVVAMKIVTDMETVVIRLNKRVDHLKAEEERLCDLVERLEATQKKEVETENLVRSAMHQRIVEALNGRKLTVVEPPLDFPNDRKE